MIDITEPFECREYPQIEYDDATYIEIRGDHGGRGQDSDKKPNGGKREVESAFQKDYYGKR